MWALPFRGMQLLHDVLGNGHSHIDGNNLVTRHGLPCPCCTATQSPTFPTSNHTFTADEQASLPPQTTWCCPSPNESPPSNGTFTKQLLESFTASPVDRAVLLSQSTSHTGPHLMQPSSEAYEAEDRCFRVAVARRFMLPQPAAPNAADVVRSCPNKSAASQSCNKPADPQQHHGCGHGEGAGA